MGIAEGREHATEICGDILHDEGERHVFLLLCRLQNHKSKRQEREKRHIVGKEHRTDEGDVYERQHAKLRILAKDDNAACECDEELDVTERANARERAEKAGQRLEIKVAEVFRIGRNHEGSADRRNQGDCEDGIGVQEIADSLDGGIKKNAERRSEIARFFRLSQNILSFESECDIICKSVSVKQGGF